MCADQQQNYLEIPDPKRMVVLHREALLQLRGRIDDLLDNMSNFPMDMHYFHIGETNNELVLSGWGFKK